MIVRYIEHELTSSGFEKEKKNSGYLYSRILGDIGLFCYIEENIKLYFYTTYNWNNNSIKGSYCVSSSDLEDCPDFSPVLFIKTIQNMPQYVGKEFDIHIKIIKAINETFFKKY